MKWNEKAKKIVEILKLRTPPVGVRFYEERYEPSDAFKPSKYGIQMAVCQAIAFARYTGRTVLLEAEDFACPPAMLLYGVVKFEGKLKDILLAAEWIKDAECEFNEKPLPAGKYKSFVFGDMTKMKEEPQAVMIFGTPAQIGRLIQAKTYFGGEVKASLTAKTASCSEALFPALNGEVTIAIPGAGDRVFAALDEVEMIFAMPYAWTDKILEGLEKAGRGANVSYPPPPFLFFTPRFPKHYREIAKKFTPV
ncbi:MAG: hypothetical protein PWQ22_270 [Archaeoglobaceae archaeon]|nr:hypothetical protein [Archaeoglobaceae archaeon]